MGRLRGRAAVVGAWSFSAGVALSSACFYEVPNLAVDAQGPDGESDARAADGGGHGNDASPNRCAEIADAGKDPNIGTGGGPPCNGDYASGASAPCPTRDRSFCNTMGQCGPCGDCTAPPGHPGPQCSRFERMCGAPCMSLTDCASDHFCDFLENQGGACVPKFGAGEPIGGLAGIVRGDGGGPPSCDALAAYGCLSGVGSLRDNGPCVCGKANGATCRSGAECAATTCASDGRCGARLGDLCSPRPPRSCRSTQCSPSCICVPACQADSDCGSTLSGKVCSTDPDVARCVDGCRTDGGNGCPFGQKCTATGGSLGVCADAGI
jgi:hypothetical protein